MVEYELIDIAFFIKSLNYTTGNFNVKNYVSFFFLCDKIMDIFWTTSQTCLN